MGGQVRVGRRGRSRFRSATWAAPLAALVGLLVGSATGCAAGASPPRQVAPQGPTASQRPAGTGDSTFPFPAPAASARDRSAAVVAYLRFWSVASTVDSQPRPRWRTLLAAVAVEPLLSRVLSGLDAQLAGGGRQYGVVRPRPVIVAQTTRSASVVDCQDASGSGVLDIDTGLPRSRGAARTAVSATLLRSPDGTWRVSDARYLDGPC